jgi:hypothetical protein
MAGRVSIKPQRIPAPQWVFNWLPLRQSSFPTAFAILTVGGGFAFCLNSVRIRVDPPTPWATHKASIIHITDDADGRTLSLRAREGGPFPSRFEPSEWESATTIEQAAFQVAHRGPPPYVPVLRNLPTKRIPPVTLAAKGESTLPKLTPEFLATPLSPILKLAPVLYPLSGIPLTAMPHTLPPFDDAVNVAMTAEPWRFLLKLDSAGNAQDCVSLTGGDEAGPPPLVAWLLHVPFPPEPAKPVRWIAVGVGFTNQPADGPDAR